MGEGGEAEKGEKHGLRGGRTLKHWNSLSISTQKLPACSPPHALSDARLPCDDAAILRRRMRLNGRQAPVEDRFKEGSIELAHKKHIVGRDGPVQARRKELQVPPIGVRFHVSRPNRGHDARDRIRCVQLTHIFNRVACVRRVACRESSTKQIRTAAAAVDARNATPRCLPRGTRKSTLCP